MERVNEIINLLLSQNDYLTTNEIAENIRVSNKTIRNEFYRVEEILDNYNLILDRKPGSGVSIIGSELDLISLKEELKNIKNIIPYSSQDRKNYILEKLFRCNNGITIRQLAQELYVSKSTIHKDFVLVEEWLNIFELKLIKKPNSGTVIEGKEQYWRNAFITLLFSRKRNEDKDKIKNDELNLNSRLDNDILNKLNFINPLDYYKIEKILSEAEKELKYDFSYEAFVSLMIHIALSIKRIEVSGISHINDEQIMNLKDTEEYVVAKNIVEKINEYFEVIMPDYEVYYITIHILGSKRYFAMSTDIYSDKLNRELLQDEILNSNDYKKDLSEVIVNEIIGIVENYLEISLDNDKQFMDALLIHIKPTINRIKYGLILRNPIIDDIESTYPEAYGIAWLSNTVFKKYFGKVISREEIGYLALHIATAIERNRKPLRVVVVCSSGIGTSQLLALKIKKHFSDLYIVDIKSSLSIIDEDLQDIDLIISTVETNTKFNKVIISPLLSEGDVRKLQMVVDSLKNKFTDVDKKTLINEEFIEINAEYINKEDLIKSVCQKLIEKGYIYEKFEESVLMREKKYTTEVGNGIAIPHGSYKYVNESTLIYISLSKKILWKEELVDKVLLFCASEKDTNQFIKFFRNFYNVIEDEDEFNKFNQFNDEKEVKNYLEKIFYM